MAPQTPLQSVFLQSGSAFTLTLVLGATGQVPAHGQDSKAGSYDSKPLGCHFGVYGKLDCESRASGWAYRSGVRAAEAGKGWLGFSWAGGAPLPLWRGEKGRAKRTGLTAGGQRWANPWWLWGFCSRDMCHGARVLIICRNRVER